MTDAIRQKIMDRAVEYGTGRDTLRCLALATCDSPINPKDMDLDNSEKFKNYEVGLIFGLIRIYFWPLLFFYNHNKLRWLGNM